ncbi:MAG: prepilin-type N-terminal cleavage/methylation domain-containing protein [Thiobacillus sp.]
MTTQRGFTLIEMAIVLVIITILIGGLAVPLSAQIQARRIAETQKTLNEARESIIGYAISQSTSTCSCEYALNNSCDITPSPGSTCPASQCASNTPSALPIACSGILAITLPRANFLPCPDLDNADPPGDADNDGQETDINNGREDRNLDGSCSGTVGNFPWVTLGTANQDAWGNRIRYAVAGDLANSTIGITRSTQAPTPPANPLWNQVFSSTANCDPLNPLNADVARDVPIVLLSHGPNGRGARNVNIPQSSATPAPPAATSPDELQNLGSVQPGCSANTYISGIQSEVFDDLTAWVGFHQLISRVCPAGGCP